MAYKDRYGITMIKPDTWNNLEICWDRETMDSEEKHPVFLFTPDMNKTGDHHHIELTKAQATELKNWLDAYLEEC